MRIISALLVLLCLQAQSQISLPKLVSNGAVLQRDEPINLWGYASPKEKITIQINKEKYKTQANEKGHWEVKIPAHPAGGPHTIILKGKNEIKVEDVLFGDVWLGSGQSNMVVNMERVKEKYPDDIASANYPQIRNFFIKTMTDLTGPQKDFPDGQWVVVSPQNVLTMGAVTYFFAREIHTRYNVPVGIINSSVGGTPIEAWISEKGFKDFDKILKTIETNKDTAAISQRLAAFRNRPGGGEQPRQPQDLGTSESPKWYETSYKPKAWADINIPGFWEDQGLNNLDGVVWFRREIDVLKEMVNTEVKLYMGRIVDSDHVYVNGTQVGNITYQYPPRRYIIPSGVLKPGKNTIVIRVQNNGGKGGFVPDKPYYMTANGMEIDLKGTWQYKVGQVIVRPPFGGGGGGGGFTAQNQPTALFNAMSAPIIAQTSIKGMLWYQGESNTGSPVIYKDYMEALVNDYRRMFNKPNLPVIGVQLANFMEQDFIPVESNWAALQHSQFLATKMPGTALAVISDAGEWNDIHPLNKKAVGDRLALAARKLAYGENDLTISGPRFSAYTIQGNKMILSFDEVGKGLKTSDGEPLKYFAIAGDDRKFVWADAKIVGDKIEVSSPEVSKPLFVRYAWANNPVGANLTNDTGIPASVFEAGIGNEKKLWHGKKATVVLTYDDALDVHLDNVVPALNRLSFLGTFYMTASAPASENRINDWRRAAQRGHELGNHTLYHPCDGSKPGRSWLTPLNDLSKYTTEQIVREVKMTNAYLESIDGKKDRTFAYTCGDTETAEGSFINAIKDEFVALRGVRGQNSTIDNVNLENVDCYSIDNSNADKLQSWAEKAIEDNALMVVLFHGVGGGHSINTDLDKHNAFLKFLKDHEDEIWVTTMVDAAQNIIDYKSSVKKDGK